MSHEFGHLFRKSSARSRRASSYDRSGGNADRINLSPGERRTFMEAQGPGCIKHIWTTMSSGDTFIRKNVVLRMYWDGADSPSVEAPIGDFFGQGWGMTYLFNSLPLSAAPKGGASLVSYLPMPFNHGARIEIENQSSSPLDAFYFYIDWEEWTGTSDDLLYFCASYRQELTQPELETDYENEWSVLGPEEKNPSDENNYVFVEAEGEGQFAGVNLYVQCPSPIWYGEGDDMFRIDGEEWPISLHGTGTEDYFNQAWCPNEHFFHPYFGTAYVPSQTPGAPDFGWMGRTHVYRFHIADPIHFKKSLRGSIEHGHANALTLAMSSVAYWYQTLPTAPLPPLPSREDRLPLPDIGVVDVHRWRDAWRREKGGGKLWGNET